MKDKKYYKKLAIETANLLDFKKAEDIVIYDTESKTGLFYYVIISTALSKPHIDALEEDISKKFKHEKNEYILHRDGIESNIWKVLDYGGIIIHIFDRETRDHYMLDKNYIECKTINWKKKVTKNTTPKTKKTTKK